MQLQPLQDRIVCRRTKPPASNVSGMFVPDSAIEKSNVCEVIAVGPGKRGKDGARVPLSIKAGEFVVLGRHGGMEITTDTGEKLLVVREDEVFAQVDADTKVEDADPA